MLLLSKKITKLNTRNGDHKAKPQKPPKVKDPNKNQRCRFVPIPQPSKNLYKDPVYTLHGDLVLTNSKNEIWSELCFINELKVYRDVMVQEMYGQRVVVIKPVDRSDQKVSHWKELITNLKHKNNEEMTEWAKIIEAYCHKYSKVMMRQSRKKLKSDCRKKFFAEVTSETERQTENLFKSHPCLQMKLRLKNHSNQINEIVLNEALIVEAGYDIESFVSLVLTEGLPKLFAYVDKRAPHLLKHFLEQYFAMREYGDKVPIVDSTLIMRNNFAKKIKLRHFFFMNYEINTFGMDIVSAINEAEEPKLTQETCHFEQLNPEFVENMVSKETEAFDFLAQFYNHSLCPKYTNLHKVCTIRELKVIEDDDIIVKKDEDI